MRSPSCGWECRRSSSARSAPAITARPSGSRCPRWRATARRSGPSCGRSRSGSLNSVPPPPGRDRSARKPGPEGDGTEPPKKKRYWWRFSLASVIIIAVSAAATSSAVLLYINSIADALGHNKVLKEKVEKELVDVNGGEPETILILGSDIRANSGEERGRSDTTILLRLDAEKKLISVMSIPRDLQTEIPGVGTEKFNAAYTYGGPKLTLQVIKELTGLKINHVINIDFLGFVRAVDAIGCVYTDVDRRYYHSN